MKKNALAKDFFMEIKKTRNRFLSIMLIAALGVAFFAGVRAAAPDMNMSADLLYDKSNFMDIRVLSDLGLTEKDIDAIRDIKGVESVRGGYSADVLCSTEEAQLVVRMMSAYEDINKITVKQGRMPEKKDECLADERFLSLSGYKIGDTISVKSGTDDDIADTLAVTEYKIVGSGTTAYYLSLDRGTSKIGNGELSSFLVIPAESFSLEVYTEAVIRVAGAKELLSGSDKYEDTVKEVEDHLDAIADGRCDIRYESVYREGQEKLDDASAEIEENQQKLEDAKKELDDGEKELADAQQKLDDAKKELQTARDKLTDGEAQLADGEAQAADGENQLADGWNTYYENASTLEEKSRELEEAEAQTADGENQIAEGWQELDTQKAALSDGRSQLEEGKAQIAQGRQQLTDGIAQTEAGIAQVEQKIQEIEAGLPAVRDGIAKVTDGIHQAEAGIADLEQKQAVVQAGIAQLEEQLAAVPPEAEDIRQQLEEQLNEAREQEAQIEAGISAASGQLADLQNTLQQLEEQKAQMDNALPQLKEQQQTLPAALEELKKQLDQLDAQAETLAEKEAELADGEDQIAQAEVLLTEKEAELAAGKAQIEDGAAQLADGENQLDEARELLESKEQELADAKAQIAQSRKELEDGKAQLADGEKEIADGESEIEKNRKKLADGRREYEEKKADADEKIADARQKVADGQKDLDDLEVPKWYILNRDFIQTYVEYEQDADRIKAIGDVFPAIFFLVAALICLTTMTRMVEEERTQIGTLKALGYSKLSIAAKYLCYALLASLIGSLAGLVAGQKILPPVIINAYGILYNNLPEAVAPLHAGYSISSTLLAIACTTAAAGIACYKELMSTPATLMRPAAPKSGKRVLLERVGIIWNHLSFTNKSTVRNLFRYKKRFFMTVLGIGGCMGLLLVGFGVKDSVRSIGTIQYNDLLSYHAEIVLEDKTTPEEKEEVMDAMEKDKDIKSFMAVYKTSMDIENEKEDVTKSAYVMVPENAKEFKKYADLRSRTTKEHYELSDDGIIISEKLAKLLDVKEGDTVVLKEEETDHFEVKVSHITENYFLHYIYISPELYGKVFGETPEFVDYLTINTSTDSAFEDSMQEKYMAYDQVSEVSFITKTADRIANMLKSLDTVIYVLVIAAGLLAFVVLYNLNNINISERIRELATLKVLGFYDMEVSRYVFRENVCLTLIGCFLGIFFGKILHRFVILTAETDIMMFGRDIEIISFVYSILITLFFSAVVNFFMHFRLKKVDMVESMKSVE
ncbi:ABC transporter permease [Blautia producta]|uniref:FtsX-like permease family protein n=1 Tax=Blautia producta TaxID=33035 RepID=UPI001D05D094|nr:FtsX-like permease family protein [Blautia producta]MCB6725174.1 ABC transporter permease [Blautia marasmi]MCQ5093748.1 ABC transporter permease [Blautia producta]